MLHNICQHHINILFIRQLQVIDLVQLHMKPLRLRLKLNILFVYLLFLWTLHTYSKNQINILNVLFLFVISVVHKKYTLHKFQFQFH